MTSWEFGNEVFSKSRELITISPEEGGKSRENGTEYGGEI